MGIVMPETPICAYLVELQVFVCERYIGNQQREERAYTAADAVTQAQIWGNNGSRRVQVQAVYPAVDTRRWKDTRSGVE